MISVIIPIYNKKKYIKRIIDVLKEQTYKDIEAIFIDDGSTDGSYKIAKSYENGKIYLFISKKTKGFLLPEIWVYFMLKEIGFPSLIQMILL